MKDLSTKIIALFNTSQLKVGGRRKKKAKYRSKKTETVRMAFPNANNIRQINCETPLTLTELPTRFVIICLNLPGSPMTISGTLSETNTASFTSTIKVQVEDQHEHQEHENAKAKHPKNGEEEMKE